MKKISKNNSDKILNIWKKLWNQKLTNMLAFFLILKTRIKFGKSGVGVLKINDPHTTNTENLIKV